MTLDIASSPLTEDAFPIPALPEPLEGSSNQYCLLQDELIETPLAVAVAQRSLHIIDGHITELQHRLKALHDFSLDPMKSEASMKLEHAIERRRRARARFARFIRAHRSFCSFVGNLPLELLSLILSFVVFDASPITWSNPFPYKSQYTLCHVCHNWRSLVQASPRLWSCIDLNLGRMPASLGSKKLLMNGLDLSRDCLLLLDIDLGRPQARSEIWDVIARWAPRWLSLSIRYQSSPSVYTRQKVHIARLRYLNVSFESVSDLDLGFPWALSDAPALQEVCLNGRLVGSILHSFTPGSPARLSWPLLTELATTYEVTTSGLLLLLQHFPSLKSLKVPIVHQHVDFPPVAEDVHYTHSNLQHLGIQSSNDNAFSHLTLPNLVELKLEPIDPSENHHFNFIRRSPDLTTLSIGLINACWIKTWIWETKIQLLTITVPSLVDLPIEESGGLFTATDFIGQIARARTVSHPLTHLKTIHICAQNLAGPIGVSLSRKLRNSLLGLVEPLYYSRSSDAFPVLERISCSVRITPDGITSKADVELMKNEFSELKAIGLPGLMLELDF